MRMPLGGPILPSGWLVPFEGDLLPQVAPSRADAVPGRPLGTRSGPHAVNEGDDGAVQRLDSPGLGRPRVVENRVSRASPGLSGRATSARGALY